MGYKLNVTSNVWVDIGAQPSCMHGWFGSTVSLVKAKLTPFCVSVSLLVLMDRLISFRAYTWIKLSSSAPEIYATYQPARSKKKRKKRETAFAILYIRNKSKIDIYIRFPYFHKIGRCSFHAGSFAGQNYILSFKIFFAPIWREKVLFIIYGRVDITVYFVRFIFKDLKLFKYKKFIF